MTRFSGSARGKGHRFGGLFLFGALTLSGCAGGAAAPEDGSRPSVRFARPLQAYRQIGLITGPTDFPAVAGVATLAGRADSTLLLLGLSLPADALRFQRDGAGFTAGYVVSVRVSRDDRLVGMVDRQETVRVAEFAETTRPDEAVLFQTALQLEPGRYALSVRVRDRLGGRGFERSDTLDVPRYGPDGRRVSRPIPVYRASPRPGTGAEPDLILNPRHAAAYGGPPPLVYVEAYGDSTATLDVRDGEGATVWTRPLRLRAGSGLSAGVLELPADSLPPGLFRLTAAAAGASSASVPLLVTISDSWLVSNFEEVIEFLHYVAPAEELEALAGGTPEERRAAWDAFWAERDPMPATPVNEFREQFFERIRVATQQFAEPGVPGWRTDRGEVYIVLGPPTRFVERPSWQGAGRPDALEAQEWVYERVPGVGPLRLIFLDRTGLGAFRLAPSSEGAFRAVAERLRRRRTR